MHICISELLPSLPHLQATRGAKAADANDAGGLKLGSANIWIFQRGASGTFRKLHWRQSKRWLLALIRSVSCFCDSYEHSSGHTIRKRSLDSKLDAGKWILFADLGSWPGCTAAPDTPAPAGAPSPPLSGRAEAATRLPVLHPLLWS